MPRVHVDQGAAAVGRQDRREGPSHAQRPEDIDVEGGLDIVETTGQQRARQQDAGVVEHDLSVQCDVRERGDRLRRTHFEFDGDDLRSFVSERRPARRIDLARSPGQQFIDESCTQAPPSAGHHNHLACHCDHMNTLPC